MKNILTLLNEKKSPADLFVIGFFEKEKLIKEMASLEPGFAKALLHAVEKQRFEGKFGQTLSSYKEDYKEAPEIIVFGLGQKKNYRHACLRKATGQILQLAKGRKVQHLRLWVDSFVGGEVKEADAAGVIAEISNLACYDFDRYKTKKEESSRSKKVEVVELLFTQAKNKAVHQEKIRRSEIIAEGMILARNLINEPGNIMNPQKLAEAASELADRKKISCEILGQKELERLKMGGILAVNQGSRTPPALIILEYGQRYKKNGTVCLVGKGVTFDTGGISIKPAKDMEKMKYDMSGAAAVIATLGVVADLKLPLHVVGLTPAVENIVAEDPQRPGDIIRMYNGKSVEVLNTDAEGRLILADALAYSEKYHPKVIVDMATLTGMCAYTFGDKAIGLLGNDEKLISSMLKAGRQTGERCWQLPLWDEYADQIRGHHSDLLNIGGPYGGTITAAMFLKEFVPAGISWAHLDIAGTAWCDSPRYDCVKGATGVGVRLLTQFLTDFKK